ncbi:hypothetical protein KTO58_04330 [Chitinophaga pendula]|uniref:hypothetical protein n=1 Tax=Chitinophaga TaxID=79328 RepID=UPI000BB03DAC|nr:MULTISPECIES: hypothetical protein [Chitinophaga]ASZ13953.1 hypothetical protein CK934_24870 [Chitinophaga sp. MD30]UCJ08425.1 hypothetical protein KTO58_04330 [Chitinophaga pendula]
MKRTLIATLLLCCACYANAQRIQTLSGHGKVKVGGYGGPAAKFTSIDNNFTVMAGAYGGVFLDKKFLLGIGGYTNVNNVPATPSKINNQHQYWQMWYGGFNGEYVHNSDKLVHFSVGALIGGGGVFRRTRFEEINEFDDHFRDYSSFFVAEPTINVEVNITTFLRVFAGGSYRFVQGSGTPGITDQKLSGPSAQIGIKAGAF